jgi:hypothetical protein
MLAVLVQSYACETPQQQPAVSQLSPEQNTTEATSVEGGQAVSWYVTVVDKLNIRAQPNKSGAVIGQLSEGALVEGTSVVSDHKEEATLRGMTYLEPYIEVVLNGTERRTGWVFRGAVQRVYAGPAASVPDLSGITQLTDFIKSLDTKQLNSGKKAWDYVATRYSNSQGALADAIFILLENFLRSMEREGEFYKLTEQVDWKGNDYEAISENRFDMNKYPASKSLADNGFRLAQGEGMVFPVTDNAKLLAFFGPKVSPAMKDFLVQQTAEQQEQAWDDGGIIIALEKLADRAAFWEKFNQENPHFVLQEQSKESERWTRLVIINGADNTPSFDYETQAVSADFRKVWDYIGKRYPGTVLSKKAGEIAELYAAEGGKRTKKIEAWRQKFAEENE